jgi:hypothetical protein
MGPDAQFERRHTRQRLHRSGSTVHVAIANGLHLLCMVSFHELVQPAEDLAQERGHVRGRAGCREWREAYQDLSASPFAVIPAAKP